MIGPYPRMVRPAIFERSTAMYLRYSLIILLSWIPLLVLAQGGKAFLKEGDDLRKQNQLEPALERYDLAVKVDPKLMKAWQAKAEINQLLGRTADCARDRRKMAELQPAEPAYATEAAKAYLEIDSPQVAMALLDQALRVDPKYMDALLTKTRACLATGDVDTAVRTADAALAQKATTDSYFIHALARTASHDYKTAEFDLEKVLEWNHLYEPAYVALSEVQLKLYEQFSGGTMRMRTVEKAIEKCTRALELNPASTDALFVRSKAFALQKEYSKAIDDVSRCIALERQDVAVYHQRALYYQGFGQHQNAVNDLNHALLQEPANPELLIIRAQCK
ncbi:MAG: tetratricopeptide repeat protein, partial [Bacteroidota bacterium]|nr:tetratricopeptide repeat protein [Bacteroidota bacterium]